MKKSRMIVILFAIYFIYSVSVLMSKFASLQENELYFLLFYGISLFFLFVYAIGWQIIIKNIPLSVAYPLKVVVIILGMIFGYFIFREQITFKMIIGTLLIFIGVFCVGKSYD
ncbi:MAG: EamA family transporter [Bacilli bacterium]|uniref:EamA family transporter n=1 Tax=Anaerorhabdus sp. TaxID=1872524 RepID=UPI002FC673BB